MSEFFVDFLVGIDSKCLKTYYKRKISMSKIFFRLIFFLSLAIPRWKVLQYVIRIEKTLNALFAELALFVIENGAKWAS